MIAIVALVLCAVSSTIAAPEGITIPIKIQPILQEEITVDPQTLTLSQKGWIGPTAWNSNVDLGGASFDFTATGADD